MIIDRYEALIPDSLDDFDQLVIDQLSAKPLDNIFNMNLNELKQNSSSVEFNSARYDMRPDRVAWDYYQSLSMTNLILLVNNTPTMLNFTREYIGPVIRVPDKTYVEKLLTSTIL